MKKIALLLLLFCGLMSAQVGINTTNPSNASVLHLESLNGSGTHGGFMPPKVTLAQRATIPVTAADDGMMIFLSDGTTRCVQIYRASSSAWVDMYCMPIVGASIIYYQDFEATPATPTLTYTGGSGSMSSGNGIFPSAPMYSEGAQGYQVSNSNSTLSFDPIDSSTYSNIDLSFDLASFAGTSGNGADGTDVVEVLVSTDNTTWSSEVTINGNNNAKWSFAGSAVASGVYDGDNTPTNYAPTMGGNLTGPNAYSKVTLSNLPAVATLYIQVRMHNNSTNEIWVIDNVVLNLN
ncbi:hypothetical protein [Pseudofulvibacter geojedonensis]|uniref:F5/8 type C domain-containing protein n=1 Tax=Pseudofulvibacter geojedonensis TaxID=1123758 RepID=A0ABW3I3V0_9FLAO